MCKGKVYVLTGDRDSESGIYSVDTANGKKKIIFKGGQEYRAVSLIQTDSHLIWGSDSPDNINYIYRAELGSLRVEKLCAIGGPAYYSARLLNGEMFLSTSIERKGLHEANIYKSTDGGSNWQIFKKFKKDVFSTKYFGNGMIEFVNGLDQSENVKYNTFGLKNEKY